MTPRPRLAVLGLDGLSLELARTLARTCRLPSLAALLEHPAATVRSELPELSPVNWTSFFTGRGPGEHGIYGFSRMDPASYRLRISNFRDVACPTIFDILGESGLTCKVVNLPGTYPAPPLRGTLISGFVAEDLVRAVHPRPLASILASDGYRLEADTSRGGSDPDHLLAELRRTLASRGRALDLLWPDLGWDLFVFVLTETDRLFHFLLHAVLDAEHALHGACREMLRDWDALIGRFVERFEALPEPRRLIVLADHGFTPCITEVDVNAWLVSRGLLRLHPPGPDAGNGEWAAERIAPGSRAFALDPGRIYIHDARFGRGAVPPAETASLRRAIREGLLELTCEGEPVMEAVHEGATLYSGREASRAPDLVAQARPGFDLKAKFDREEVFGLYGRTGTHTARGAIWIDTEGSRPERLRDTGREVLSHFGLGLPDGPGSLLL